MKCHCLESTQEVPLDRKSSWRCPICRSNHTFIPYQFLPKRDKKQCRKAAIRMKFNRDKPWKPIEVKEDHSAFL